MFLDLHGIHPTFGNRFVKIVQCIDQLRCLKDSSSNPAVLQHLEHSLTLALSLGVHCSRPSVIRGPVQFFMPRLPPPAASRSHLPVAL